MKLKRKRVVRKLKRNWKSISVFFFIALAINTLVTASLPNSGLEIKSAANNSNSNSNLNISAEYIYSNICMKCHITPTKYQSFTGYFGKSEAVWRIGVNKMVTAGNVRLTAEQIDELAKYLSKLFGG